VTETQREPAPRIDTTEKDTAFAFLDFARHCVAKKLDGLDEEQARRVLVPSGTSLLGLVAHLTDGERYWFGHHVAGDSRWADVDFEGDSTKPKDEVLAAYEAAVRDSNAILAGVELDTRVQVLVDDQPLSVRWVVAHMTSEVARHAGHADILREQIDGVTGR
jgi:hypothetical protein